MYTPEITRGCNSLVPSQASIKEPIPPHTVTHTHALAKVSFCILSCTLLSGLRNYTLSALLHFTRYTRQHTRTRTWQTDHITFGLRKVVIYTEGPLAIRIVNTQVCRANTVICSVVEQSKVQLCVPTSAATAGILGPSLARAGSCGLATLI